MEAEEFVREDPSFFAEFSGPVVVTQGIPDNHVLAVDGFGIGVGGAQPRVLAADVDPRLGA